MKIGLAAYEYRNNDVAFNISQMEAAARQARGKAELLCFGETFLQGFDSLCWDFERDRKAGVSQTSDCMKRIRAVSAESGVDLLFGYIELEGERLYSSCAVIAGGEILHNYRRVSVGWKEHWKTDAHYCEGTDTSSFLYRGRRIKLALCGDLWDMPDRFRTEDLLIWPVYVSFTPEEWELERLEYAEQAGRVADRTLMVNAITKEPKAHGGAFDFVRGRVNGQLPCDREDILVVKA